MKQYCRYCAWLNVNNEPYCSALNKTIPEKRAKAVNNCKEFSFADVEPRLQDAFFETKGYRPRNKTKNIFTKDWRKEE